MNFLTPQDEKQSYFWGGEMAAKRYDCHALHTKYQLIGIETLHKNWVEAILTQNPDMHLIHV